MARSSFKPEISASVIDLGDKIINTTHVTSAGHGTVHPFRPIGVVLLLAAVGLVGTDVATKGMAAFSVSRGAPLLWLGFAAAGVGLFLTLFAQRLFEIRTVDGARTPVPSADDDASNALIASIRSALEQAASERMVGYAPGAALPASPASEKPAALTASPSADSLRSLPTTGPHTGPPGGGAASAANGSRRPDPYLNGQGGSTRPMHANGAARQEPAAALERGRGYDGGRSVAQSPHSEGRGHADAGGPYAKAGAVAARPSLAPSGSDDQSLDAYAPGPALGRQGRSPERPLAPAPPRDDPAHDLRQLIEHVQRADVQHKVALLDLLRVVDDFYDGKASREDAVAHWSSFSEYVTQYLTDVDGLTTFTDRFARHMPI